MTHITTLGRIAFAVFILSLAANLFTFVYVVTVCKGKDYCNVLGFEIERVR